MKPKNTPKELLWKGSYADTSGKMQMHEWMRTQTNMPWMLFNREMFTWFF